MIGDARRRRKPVRVSAGISGVSIKAALGIIYKTIHTSIPSLRYVWDVDEFSDSSTAQTSHIISYYTLLYYIY